MDSSKKHDQDGWEDVPLNEEDWEDVPAEGGVEAPVEVNPEKRAPGVLDTARAFMSGVEEGIPFSGAADKAGAAMAAGAAKLTYGKDKTFGENYDASLKALRDQRNETEALNPEAAQIGTGVAGFVSPAAEGGLLGRVLQSIGFGGADAALKEDSVKKAIQKGLVTGGFAGAIEALVPQAKGLRKTANERAVKSLDPMLSQQVQLNRKGVADQVGQELLDEGVVKFGSNVEEMAPRIKGLLEKWGKGIGAIRDEATQAGAKVDLSDLAPKAEQLAEAAASSNKGAGQFAAEYGDNVQRYLTKPQRSVNEIQQEILSLNDRVPFQKEFADFTPDQRAFKELRGDLVGKMDESIKGAAPDKFDQYKGLKEKFSLFKDADSIAERSVARQLRNQDFGLKDAMLLSTGGPEGVVMAGANKLLRERGNAAGAVMADRAARLLEKAPQKLGKFGPAIEKALSEGNKSLGITHYLLYRNDPEYRKIIDETEVEE